MTEPHHHVYNAVQQKIIKAVKIDAILPHLLEKKVIEDDEIYRKQPKSAMKILIGYLRNQSFETFLSFVECIFEAQRVAPAKVQALPVVESMIRAVQDFDAKNQTTHAERVVVIQEKYLKQLHTETETKQQQSPQLVHEATALATPTDSVQTEAAAETPVELPSHMQQLSLLPSLSMPDLDYVEEPLQVSFQSDGGNFTKFFRAYGFSLSVPAMAVPKGQEVNLKVGLCCCGPFSISEQYLLVSDFAVVVADGGFIKPVTVTMEHCLVLPEYKKCSDVVILKANHRKVTEDGLYTFDQCTNPDLYPNSAELTFEIEEFCILCAVLKSDTVKAITSSPPSSSDSPGYLIDEDNPSSAPSSFDEESQPMLERTYSSDSNPPAAPVFSTSSESGMEVTLASSSPKRPSLGKRKSGSVDDEPPSASVVHHRHRASAKARDRKRHCGVEYAALLFQNSNMMINPDQEYEFVIFIATNCPVANEVCMKHAAEKLGPNLDITPIPIDVKNALEFEIVVKSSGWTVDPDRSATLALSEVQFHTMTRSDLFARLKQKTCPPRLLFTAECSGGGSKKFSCKVTIRGAVTAETRAEVFFNVRAKMPVYSGFPARQNAIDYNHHSFNHNQHYSPDMPYHNPRDPSGYIVQSNPFPHHRQENISPNLSLRSSLEQPPPGVQWVTSLSQSSSNPDLSQAQYYSESAVPQAAPPWQGSNGRYQDHNSHNQRRQFQVPQPGCRPALGASGGSQDSPVQIHNVNIQAVSVFNNHGVVARQTSQESDSLMNSLTSNFGFEKLCASDTEMDITPRYSEYHPIEHYRNLLTEEEKAVVVQDMVYHTKIIRHMNNWKKVARCGFEFTEAEVEHICHDYFHQGGFQECAYQAYLQWKTRKGHTNPVSLWTMLEILHTAGQFEAIYFLLKEFKKDAEIMSH